MSTLLLLHDSLARQAGDDPEEKEASRIHQEWEKYNIFEGLLTGTNERNAFAEMTASSWPLLLFLFLFFLFLFLFLFQKKVPATNGDFFVVAKTVPATYGDFDFFFSKYPRF